MELLSLPNYMGRSIALWVLLGLHFYTKAQQPDLSFHHITQANGLSYNIVNCFLKDSRGLLWIGTYNGLNRYDGAHFTIFRKQKHANSLPDNTVHDLAEDAQGNIWGATEAGIFKYTPSTGKFASYLTLPQNTTQVCFNILVDKNGIIRASNAFNVVQYDAAKDAFVPIPLQPASQQLFTRIYTRKNGMVASPDGRGLYLTTQQGFLYYNIAAATLTAAQNNSGNALFTANSSAALCATPYGHFWYYDNEQKALVAFDPLTQKLLYKKQPPGFAGIGPMATVFEDNNHVLWLSTWNYEVLRYDYLHSDSITLVQHNKAIRSSIAGDFFWAAMHEEDGTIWLGTVGGISRFNTQKAFYKMHYFDQWVLAKNDASFDFVGEQKADGSWWLGTTQQQLLHYKPATGETTVFDLKLLRKNKMGLTPFKINNLVFANDAVYLFCNAGAWVKRGNNSFVPLTIAGMPDTVLADQGLMTNDGSLWMTGNEKLWYWQGESNSVKCFAHGKGLTLDKKPPLADFLCLSANEEPWVLAGDDYFAHPSGDTLALVKATATKQSGAIGYYTAMTADAQGNLWVSKKGDGLYRFHAQSGAYQLYRQYDGLVMDHIMDATPDAAGRIWVSAYNQFSVFNNAVNSFSNFTLPINENRYGYENYSTTLANGHVLSTIGDKVVEFFPDKLQPTAVKKKPVISAVIAGGKEKLLPTNSVIDLSADENDLHFQFGLLVDGEESPFDMQYRLAGTDKSWSTASANFAATYNKLAPGNYSFIVRAMARDSSWQSEETGVAITLAAPFYRTAWFSLLMLGLVAGIIYFIYRYRLQKHRQVMALEGKAQLLEKEKAMAMFENLKQQLNPHFLFNSISSLSGLIEADQPMAMEFLEQMSGIYRYILRHADSDKVSLREELEFVALYINLQQTRFEEGLQVRINVPEDYMHYKIAPVTLQNLIENAIKHNVIDAASPLIIHMYVEDYYLVVSNNLQKKRVVETSNQKGLAQFVSLYKFLTDKPVRITTSDTMFTISIPLI